VQFSTLARRSALPIVTALLATGLQIPMQTAQAAPSGRFALGDSVMLGAKARLENRNYSVNAKTSRQVQSGVDLLRAKARDNSLRTNVVVHLGTNGTFTQQQCRAMHSVVGSSRRLFLVTVNVPRSWAKPNNRVINRCAARYSNTYLVDWRGFVKRHPGVVESDGYHLTYAGARKDAALIDQRVAAALRRG